MKIKLSMAIFSLFTLLNTSVLAQDGPRINREVACSVNDGFAMSDVVQAARDIERDEDLAPGAIFMREAYAVSGEFQNNWDFVYSTIFENFEAMSAKVGAQRARPGGRMGVPLSDMVSCGPRARISLVNVANPGDVFDGIESAPMATLNCQLNDSDLGDAMARAAEFGQRMDAYSAVANRIFGGPVPESPSVGMRIVFANGETFGQAMDAFIASGGPSQPSDSMTCNGGSLWVVHRIHSTD
jgi:hypothetical protein